MAHAPWSADGVRRRVGASPGAAGPAVVLDGTAKQIIEQLQQDGRPPCRWRRRSGGRLAAVAR